MNPCTVFLLFLFLIQGFFASVRCLPFFSPLLELPSTSFPPSFFVTRHKKLLLQKKEEGETTIRRSFVETEQKSSRSRTIITVLRDSPLFFLPSFLPLLYWNIDTGIWARRGQKSHRGGETNAFTGKSPSIRQIEFSSLFSFSLAAAATGECNFVNLLEKICSRKLDQIKSRGRKKPFCEQKECARFPSRIRKAFRSNFWRIRKVAVKSGKNPLAAVTQMEIEPISLFFSPFQGLIASRLSPPKNIVAQKTTLHLFIGHDKGMDYNGGTNYYCFFFSFVVQHSDLKTWNIPTGVRRLLNIYLFAQKNQHVLAKKSRKNRQKIFPMLYLPPLSLLFLKRRKTP